jgi:lipopolysaccharide exporter
VLICLALAGVPLTVGWTAGDVFKATGRPHLLKNLVLLEILLTAPMVWMTAIIMRDVFWVAVAMVVAETASAFLRLHFMRRFGNLAISASLLAIAPPLIAATAMGIVVVLFTMQEFLPPAGPTWRARSQSASSAMQSP